MNEFSEKWSSWPWSCLFSAIELQPFQDSMNGRDPSYFGMEGKLLFAFCTIVIHSQTKHLECAICGNQFLRNYAGIDLSIEAVSDAAALRNFRHWLEASVSTQMILPKSMPAWITRELS